MLQPRKEREKEEPRRGHHRSCAHDQVYGDLLYDPGDDLSSEGLGDADDRRDGGDPAPSGPEGLRHGSVEDTDAVVYETYAAGDEDAAFYENYGLLSFQIRHGASDLFGPRVLYCFFAHTKSRNMRLL